jgi:hypothetical protein
MIVHRPRTVGELKKTLAVYPDDMELTGYNGSDSPDVPIALYLASPMQLVQIKMTDGSMKDVEVEICDGKVEGKPLPIKLTISVCH